ncbi:MULTISPECIES: DUF6443 domain-containing protein [Chitinophagaceae]
MGIHSLQAQNVSYGKYTGQSEITTNSGSITLTNGFSVTGGQQTRIYIKQAGPVLPPSTLSAPNVASALTSSLNYIAVWTANAPDQSPTNLVTRPLKDVKLAVQYYDGLGRPIQTIAKQGSLESATGNSKDLVLPRVYDNLGRASQQYLPYCSGSNNGSYKEDANTAQPGFYSSATFLAGQGENASNALARSIYEPSPLGRVVESFAPGNSWVGTSGNADPGARASIKAKFWSNAPLDAVVKWTAAYASLGQWGGYTSGGVYDSGALHKDVVVDEQGKQVIVFRDKQGLTILKKVQLTANADAGWGSGYTGWLCTYYIYDDFGQLRASIQPEAVKKMSETGNWTLTSDQLNEQCFRYEYDARGRVAMKKTPGIGETRMLYDARGRVAAVQDANMRSSNQWVVSLYDELDRVLQTGTYTNGSDYAQLYAQTLAQSAFTPAIDLLTETHYDDYDGLNGVAGVSGDFKTDWNKEFAATSNSQYPYPQMPAKGPALSAQGQVTWTKTKVLATTGSAQYLVSTSIYDEDGRAVQAQSQNITGGVDVSTVQYSWAGQTLINVQKTQNTKVAGGGVTVVVSKMTYDDLGRLAATEKKQSDARVAGGTMTAYRTVAVLQYDALGHVKKKELGKQKEDTDIELPSALETLNYDYNIRGWLLGVNRDYVKDLNSLVQTDGAATTDGERFTTSNEGPVTYQTTNYFGFDLGYDKQQNNLIGNQSYTAKQLNGSITGMVWKSASDQRVRKYDFRYDAANRLLQADFGQYTNGAFKKDKVDYSVRMGNDGNDPLSAYDYNGNIQKMSQMGLRKDNTSGLVDNLTYLYKSGTNRLLSVQDAAPNTTADNLGDFNKIAHTGDDYSYDANGNMTADRNKDIRSVAYNFLDLPTTVVVANKTIEYLYDATGAQLQKKVTVGTKVTTTSYIGIGVYESVQDGSTQGVETLQYFGMEEGRVRVSTSGGTGHFAYDYFIADHLGNTRMVLTDDYDVASPVLEASSYYPFGLRMAAIGYKSALGVANPSGYQGGSSDFEESTGWNGFALRSYDPQTGRFVQADPFDQFPSPYTGMGNDPVNNADPSGGLAIDFGTIGQITGSALADRALITLAGAAAGYGMDRAMGGNGWKGAAMGGGMALGGTFIPPFNIGAVSQFASAIANSGAALTARSVDPSDILRSGSPSSSSAGVDDASSSKEGESMFHYANYEGRVIIKHGLDYYKNRFDYFRQNNPEMKPPDYYMNYGDKYIRRFVNITKAQLSIEGQKWLYKALVNLQNAMDKGIEQDPSIEYDNEKFTDFAFGTHADAYTNAGILKLSIMDKIKISLTVDPDDLLSSRGISQAAEVARRQMNVYLADPFFALSQAREFMKNLPEIKKLIRQYVNQKGAPPQINIIGILLGPYLPLIPPVIPYFQ